MFKLKELRAEKRLTQKDMAQILECGQPNIVAIEKEGKDLTDYQLGILNERYGEDYVNSFYIDQDIKKTSEETRPRIPLNAAAGSISVALDGVTNDDSEQLPFVSAFSNYNYTILVKGDSMEPEFKSGDELACLQLTNGKASFIQWGRYHVLDTAQGVVVKRIYDNGEYILCKSENSDFYPDFKILKEDIYNIGLVIGMLRRY